MNRIQNFYKVREDGQFMTLDMSVSEVYALGEISTVVEVRWTDALTQKTASLKSAHGVFASVVPGGDCIAAIVHQNDAVLPDSMLHVVNPDGTIRLTVPNVQKVINGHVRPGTFGWVCEAIHPAPNVFGVVFQTHDGSNADFWLDIDATKGKVLACHWSK